MRGAAADAPAALGHVEVAGDEARRDARARTASIISTAKSRQVPLFLASVCAGGCTPRSERAM